MRGILAGALALVTLHTLVTYSGATGRIAGIGEGVADLVERFLDPARPAIGEHAKVAAPTAAATPTSIAYPPRGTSPLAAASSN